MKRVLFSLILLAMLPAVAMAEHVESARAQQAAKTFLNTNGVNANKLTDLSAEAGFTNLYIYNADKGFVVMAADDRVQPVLGYSLTGSFDPDAMPDNVRAWLQGYSDEIQWTVENNTKATEETAQQWSDLVNGVRGTKATVVVEPLLYTMWDQGEPYYNLCPTATSGGTTYHAVTGCVATAMAQIMKYWNWPIKGNGSYSYKPTGFAQQSVNFGNTTYDWANMTDTYDANSTEAEQTAVATLMWHCGVSVNMAYGLDASGAQSSSIPNALKNYFRYNTSVSMKYKSSYTNTNWTNLIKGELDAHRPVQYSGNDGSVGHAFVCDGYDNSNYFHFNWGWSGMYDGFFTLNTLNPGTGGTGSGSGNYNQSQSAIINWYPTYSVNSAPTLTVTLTQDQTTRNANLSWTSVSGVSSYQVFRNRKLIATTTSTSYTDVKAPYGENKYYVRGVTSTNGVSQPSTEVVVAFENPTNLVVTLDDGLFEMSWTGTVLAHSYNVYCNGFNIGTTEETSLSFTLGAYGDLVFCVTAVDFNEDESMPSNNSETLFQEFYGPLVDLTATIEENDVALSWDALESDTGYISPLGGYDGSIYGSSLSSNGAYWALRFPPSELSFYAGMAVLEVESWFYEAGTYQVSIYQGTNNDAPAGSPIATTSKTLAAQASWQTFTFDNPVFIDHTRDLWVVFYSSNVSMLLLADMENPYADYYSTNGTTWNHATGCTWIVDVTISDGAYTYNLYRNDEAIASNMTTTSYTDNDLSLGRYNYYVKTNYYGGESAASNVVSFEIADQAVPLGAGWNWWAPIVVTDNMLDQLQHAPGVLLITSQSGDPVSSIVPGQMYKIQTSETVNLNMIGVVADLNTLEITIAPDINWFGYPGKTALNINAMNITPADGDKIISQDEGFATYQNGAWTGTLTTLQPGHGYIYVSVAQEDKTLRF